MRIAQGTAVLLLLTLSVAPASASGWVPVGCEERMAEIARILDIGEKQVRGRWAQHRKFVLQAEPGEAYYAPRPFPRTREDVLEDFRYVFFERLHDAGPDGLDERDRAVYEGLQAGTLVLTVDRVENWTTSRCSPERPVPYHHLIRMFRPDGEELARATILPSGLLGQYAPVTAVATRGFVASDEVENRVRAMLGRALHAQRVQYAAVDGLPLRCDSLIPCTVFEADERTWILDRGALLYELPAAGRRLTVTELREEDRRKGLRPLGPPAPDSPLVSRGFGWAEAALVAVDEELAEIQGLKVQQ